MGQTCKTETREVALQRFGCGSQQRPILAAMVLWKTTVPALLFA
jgi:hypothetical protein